MVPLASLGLKAVKGGRLRVLLNALGYQGTTPAEVWPGEALLLWLADLMSVRATLHPGHQEVLLSELGADVVRYGTALAEALASGSPELPVGLLSVGNGRMATVSGRDGAFDLGRGEWVHGVKTFPMESVTYNLAAIYVGNARK